MKPLFVHIPKTGGMSIRHGLKGKIAIASPGQLCSEEYEQGLRQRMEEDGQHHGLGHARWRDMCLELQKRSAFASVRNPWARVASRYMYAIQALRRKANRYWKTCQGIADFDSFLDQRHEYIKKPYYWHRAIHGWYQQVDHVTDEEGKLRCDILRTEHLNDDLRGYLGWELPARRRNVTTNARPYGELYEDRQIQIVADWYAKDIEFFGFDFDSPATRNVYNAREENAVG